MFASALGPAVDHAIAAIQDDAVDIRSELAILRLLLDDDITSIKQRLDLFSLSADTCMSQPKVLRMPSLSARLPHPFPCAPVAAGDLLPQHMKLHA